MSDLFSETDLKTLGAEICGGETEIFLELLGDCRSDMKNHLQDLKTSRAEADWRTFNRSAHTLKSTARTFGSPRITKIALDLEKQSEDGVLEKDLQRIDDKSAELEAGVKEFDSILGAISEDPAKFLS